MKLASLAHTSILDLWPPELWGNKYLLVKPPVCNICYDNHRKHTWVKQMGSDISELDTKIRCDLVVWAKGWEQAIPAFHAPPWGSRDPKNSLVGGGDTCWRISCPLPKKVCPRSVRTGQETSSDQRSSQTPLLSKYQRLGSTGKENRKTAESSRGKEKSVGWTVSIFPDVCFTSPTCWNPSFGTGCLPAQP